MRYGLAVLFLVSMAAVSQGPEKRDSEPKAATQSSAADQRGTDQAPVVVKVLPAPDAQTKAAEDKKEREDKADTERWLTRFTFGLILVGVLQLIVFGLQAKRLRETVEATTTIANAEEARTAILERSYVFAVPAKAPTDGREHRYRLFVENFGRTPAIVKAVQWSLKPLNGLPARPVYGQDLAVHQVLHPNAPKMPTKAEAIDYINWTAPHIVFGRVVYEDVFKKLHTSGFMYLIDGDEHRGFQHLSLDGYPEYLAWD